MNGSERMESPQGHGDTQTRPRRITDTQQSRNEEPSGRRHECKLKPREVKPTQRAHKYELRLYSSNKWKKARDKTTSRRLDVKSTKTHEQIHQMEGGTRLGDTETSRRRINKESGAKKGEADRTPLQEIAPKIQAPDQWPPRLHLE